MTDTCLHVRHVSVIRQSPNYREVRRNQLNVYKKIDSVISRIEKYTACGMLVAIVLIGSAQIFFRFVLKSSLIWSEELMRYMFVWLSFITASIAVREHKHISVDFVTSFVPAKINRIFYLISRLAILVYFYFMIPAGFALCAKTAANKSTILPVTWNYVYAALPAGMILMAISLVSVFAGDMKVFKEKIEFEAKKEGK